jgi:organic radical activating enzyme
MKLPIVEMFVTAQGEGERTGVPSLFIRFGGCSLSCPGFGYEVEKDGKILIGCDSIHAVNTAFKDSWNFYDDHQVILQEIAKLDKKFEDIVITGGEPMVHHKNPVFILLIKSLMEQYEVYMETNGTIAVDFEDYPIYKKLHLTLSPKMSVSGENESNRIRIDVLKSYISNAKHAVLKIVMGKKDVKNPKEIQDLIERLQTKIPVYIMPLGATRMELMEVFPTVWDFAQLNGYRVSDRLHVWIFSDKQGV